MYIALTSDQSKALDSYMINEKKIPGIVLMENAALSVIDKICGMDDVSSAAVVCGTGNNGGDGFAVARGLMIRGYDVTVIAVGSVDRIRGDAKVNYDIIAGSHDIFFADDYSDMDLISEMLPASDIVIDAMFGTGLDRPVEGVYAGVIEAVNHCGRPVLSIDIPSGVNADSGQIMGCCVCADWTVTFQTAKRGHFLYPGAACVGELTVAVIGDDEGCDVYDGSEVEVFFPDDEDLSVAARKSDANKGDFGKLLIIAGSEGMAGAARLCAEAAVRTGAGLTTVATVGYVADRLQTALPEVIVKVLRDDNGAVHGDSVRALDSFLADKDAVAVGPGIGTGEGARILVEHIVTNRDIIKVFDADALNVLSENMDILYEKEGRILLTPHPKEFSRLSGLSVKDILSDPVEVVKNFAANYGVSVLLKGACTVVCDESGAVSFACGDVPGLAKGGSGDVLTGIIATLAAQNDDVSMSAVLGACLHKAAGLRAQEAMGEYSVTARDIIFEIGPSMSAVTIDGDDMCGCHFGDEEEEEEAFEAYGEPSQDEPLDDVTPEEPEYDEPDDYDDDEDDDDGYRYGGLDDGLEDEEECEYEEEEPELGLFGEKPKKKEDDGPHLEYKEY